MLEQLTEILTEKHIPFHEEEGEIRLLRGSTAIFLDVRPWGESRLVHMHSPVVIGFPKEAEVEAHMIVNSLNRSTYFATFVVYDDPDSGGASIEVEMDLLADDMQASELLNALGLVSGLADRYDDELAAQLRGRRFQDVNAS